MDIFAAPSTPPRPLPRCVQARSDHPQPVLGVDRAVTKGALQTNKFYLNLLLGDQDCPAYVVPYTVSWTKGRGPTGGWGLTVSYAAAEQRVLGPTTGSCGHPTRPAAYYYSPPVTQNLVLDAAELDAHTALTVEAPAAMSVQVSLRPGGPQQPAAVQFPLVQGQGFVTALYGGARPVVRSAAAFLGIDVCDLPGVRRFVLQLSDGTAWLLYARSRARTARLELYRDDASASVLVSRVPFAGSVQVARLTGPQDTAVYDRAAGVYAHGVTLTGHVAADGRTGGYGFAFAKGDAGGDAGGDAAFAARTPLVHFALPHHCASFAAATRAAVQGGTTLQTPTKGVARAVLADAWALEERALPADLGFLPWNGRTRRTAATAGRPLAAPGQPGSVLTPGLHAAMVAAARQELAQDMDAQSDLDSMYFAGKALAKFATVVLAAQALLGPAALGGGDSGDGAAVVADGLRRLRAAFARFAENRQRHPLVYESAWGGVVSSGAYTTGDAMTDFGGTFYNDHHFHYGYFVYAGAVLAHLDPAWLQDAAGPAFVDMLVRDYASAGGGGASSSSSSPSSPGPPPLFPDSRSFDWYHGHSWAHGLFQSMDGKTQESSSEDTMALYALRLWGLARGDGVLAARAAVQLAVQARALQAYYYYGAGASGSSCGEATQPPAFAGNKVAGILFENKVDHTTFFGNAPEYIHGIHMLPLLPCSPYARPPAFVADEWADLFGGGRADAVPGGWRGVLYGNLATADPAAGLAFFGRPDFDMGLLDQGASRTWYLCYAAALLEDERRG